MNFNSEAMTQTTNDNHPKLRSCGICDFKGEAVGKICPQCEEPTLSDPETIAVIGFLMALCGVFLVFLMGWLIFVLRESLAQAGKPGSIYRPNPNTPPGGEMIAYFILNLALFVGLAILIVGAVQWYQQRRNVPLLNFIIRLISAMFIICQALMLLSQ